MAGKSHYSKTYAEARRRFVDAARLVGASVHSYRIRVDGDEELSIDVAIQGPDDAPTIVTSSGVHGVEGYFGSAVQLSLLERWRTYGCDNETRHVLIHAVNPFGFSHLRRFNEENIDLNRNFLLPGDAYSGSPDGYARLNPSQILGLHRHRSSCSSRRQSGTLGVMVLHR
ncbi:MAG: DUF2817 domain-containing protein [Pirellulaceae bacterium]